MFFTSKNPKCEKIAIGHTKWVRCKKSEVLRKKRNELMHTLRTKVQDEQKQHIQDWPGNLQNCNNNSNKCFRSLRLINRLGQCQRQPLLKKKPSENLVKKNEARCKIFADYFKTVMNEASSDAETMKVLMKNSKNRNHSSEVSLEEVTKAVKSLKNGKSPGADLLRSEAVKSALESIITALQEIMNKVILQKKLPNIAEIGILNPIRKPDEHPRLLESYRPIRLLPLTRKISAIKILNRNSKAAMKRIPKGQKVRLNKYWVRKCYMRKHQWQIRYPSIPNWSKCSKKLTTWE